MPPEFEWVYPGTLARSCRPGYHDETPSVAKLGRWMNQVSRLGIRSILCLLSEPELWQNYGFNGLDLLACYRSHGFQVGHVPLPDEVEPTLCPRDFLQIRITLSQLAAPYLIHCSAGIDRTGAVIEFIRSRPSLVKHRQG